VSNCLYSGPWYHEWGDWRWNWKTVFRIPARDCGESGRAEWC